MSAVLQSREYVRKMTEEDLLSVIEIEEASYPFPWTHGIFRDCLHIGYSCWVYEVDDVIQAYAVMSTGAGEAHILTLVVKDEYRGQGIGKMLMRFLIDLARQYHVETILLEVRPSNKIAVKLYEKLGFNELGLRPDYYPAENGREDALIMALNVSDDSPFQAV